MCSYFFFLLIILNLGSQSILDAARKNVPRLILIRIWTRVFSRTCKCFPREREHYMCLFCCEHLPPSSPLHIPFRVSAFPLQRRERVKTITHDARISHASLWVRSSRVATLEAHVSKFVCRLRQIKFH